MVPAGKTSSTPVHTTSSLPAHSGRPAGSTGSGSCAAAWAQHRCSIAPVIYKSVRRRPGYSGHRNGLLAPLNDRHWCGVCIGYCSWCRRRFGFAIVVGVLRDVADNGLTAVTNGDILALICFRIWASAVLGSFMSWLVKGRSWPAGRQVHRRERRRPRGPAPQAHGQKIK